MEEEFLTEGTHGAPVEADVAPAEAPAPATEPLAPAVPAVPTPSEIASEIVKGIEAAGVTIDSKVQSVLTGVFKALDFVAKDLIPAKDTKEYDDFQIAFQQIIVGEVSIEQGILSMKALFSK